MKRILTVISALVLGVSILSAQDANLRKISGPDGNVELSFRLRDGHIPVYSLDYKGKPVIGESHLGFRLAGSGMYDWFEIADTQTREIDETWNPVWGEESEIRNRCNEMTVTLRQTSSNRFMKVCFR
ncbi:MAG: glycoside hydrolase family 97 N-terminal domain-containing protein, partial [Candidatus Cryptobacteroides sp.]